MCDCNTGNYGWGLNKRLTTAASGHKTFSTDKLPSAFDGLCQKTCFKLLFWACVSFVSLYIVQNTIAHFEVAQKTLSFLKENDWDSLFSQGVIRLTQMTHLLHQTNYPFSQLCHRGICKNPRDIKDKHRLLIPISSVSLTSLLIKTLVWLNWLGPIQSSSSTLLKPKLLVSVMRQASKARGENILRQLLSPEPLLFFQQHHWLRMEHLDD